LIKQLTFQKIANILKTVKNVTTRPISYITAGVQNAHTELWRLYTMHYSISSSHPQRTAGTQQKQMLLQLWQNEVTLNTHCNVS